MTDVISTSFKQRALGSATQIDLDADSIYVMLTRSYTPSAAHDGRDDRIANSVSGTGDVNAGGGRCSGRRT